MKDYSTEAGNSQPTCPTRHPFRILQEIQCTWHHIMSSARTSSSSSAYKATLNKQKRQPAFITSSKETSSNKIKSATCQSVPSKTNAQGYSKVPQKTRDAVINKQNGMLTGCKNRIPESSDLNKNHVGSLTSSPKWSHIKNKFESTENAPSKVKLGKSISLPPKDDDLQRLKVTAIHSPSKSLTSLVPDSKFSTSRSSNINPTKSVNLKRSLNTIAGSKDEIKTTDSQNKAKNESITSLSRLSFGSTASAKERTKYNYLRNSQFNGISTLGTSTMSNSQMSPKNSLKRSVVASNKPRNVVKENFDEKPVLAFKGEKPLHQVDTPKNVKASSDADELTMKRVLNSGAQNRTASYSNNKINTNGAESKTMSSEREKITNLITHESSNDKSGKTVWVKDGAGNWTKKSGNNSTDSKFSHSKVSLLRSKFADTCKEPETKSNPLAKSKTTTNVPYKSNTTQLERSLVKSSTTSNVCDRNFRSNNLSRSSFTEKDHKGLSISNKTEAKSISEPLKTTTVANEPKQKSKSVGDVSPTSSTNLNLVQRAVLSYEGSMSLLSPETRKRLKLLSEKVKAQTDDDKLLASRSKNDILSSKSFGAYSPQYPRSKTDSGIQKKVNYNASELGERIQPVRSFLTRYQQRSRVDTSSDNSLSKKTEDVPSTSLLSSSISSLLNGQSKYRKDSAASFLNKDTTTGVTPKTLNGSHPNTNEHKYEPCSGQASESSLITKDKGDPMLMPNSSFLWRRSDATSSEPSKSSTTSSVSLTSSDFKNYTDVENYYSSVEVEIEKRSETSDEPIYIDSQGSGESDSCYASASVRAYQNLGKSDKICADDAWTDLSEDEHVRNSVSSNQSSTLKKKKNKRYSASQKDYQRPEFDNLWNISHKHVPKSQLTKSFTDSSDTLIDDKVENESTFDLGDSNHFYEPVYESLGNYLLSDDNCSISLSPDDDRSADLMQSSLTSIESIENLKHDDSHKDGTKPDPSKESESNVESKKSGNKISQLKRHLSWTKNDIRLELSSKFNKIKIKKNFQNSTEIGVKVQESRSVSTSPKKKTFIKCILRQKSANSIPVKRSPSPKKESAMFYVHLSMGRQKQRPCSEPVTTDGPPEAIKPKDFQVRKQSEPSIPVAAVPNQTRQLPKVRKFSSGPIVQRPKTAPPLPPTKVNNTKCPVPSIKTEECKSTNGDTYDNPQNTYAVLDPVFCDAQLDRSSCGLTQSSNPASFMRHKSGVSGKVSKIPSSTCNGDRLQPPNSLLLPQLPKFTSENLKSPFEEEPMYQFYHKDAQQRATLWFSSDGTESEFDDDTTSKLSEGEQPPTKPVLQSQLSAMDLVHGEGGLRTLWCEVPEVINSGILQLKSAQERKIQEAMFEVITSEASYLRSLTFLLDHFVACPEFSGEYTDKHVLDKRERHILFSDIQPVRDVSARLLADLEKRWLENIVISNICDIIYYHASNYFSVYVKYCSNQLYQERTLKELKNKRPEFVSVLKRLESNPICQSLDMHSFLMLPMQRITRLPLLIDAIFHRLSVDSPIYGSCKMALATLNKIVAECNEGARKMERMEEMLVISQQLDFKECKGFGLLSASRWLVKKGELVQLMLDNSSRRTFGRAVRWCKIQLYLFLFTDLLVVTRRKSDDTYSVIDYCPRNMVQVVPVDENTPPLLQRLPSSYRNIFQMIMLNNREGKTVEMLLSCLLESDRTRWMNAVTPAKSENPDEKIYEEWDCPQVQCTHAYVAQQPDELSLEETDVVNVFRKMADGWFEGERIRDGVRGWFPSSHSVEIINSHVRARNLHQRYRLLMLSQNYLEEQYKAQVLQTKK